MWPGEVKDFSLWVLYKKTEFQKKLWSYIVATKEMSIWIIKRFTLQNEKTIIDKG